jgi:hypothetical protein
MQHVTVGMTPLWPSPLCRQIKSRVYSTPKAIPSPVAVAMAELVAKVMQKEERHGGEARHSVRVSYPSLSHLSWPDEVRTHCAYSLYMFSAAGFSRKRRDSPDVLAVGRVGGVRATKT